jgi:hypothetical protein
MIGPSSARTPSMASTPEGAAAQATGRGAPAIAPPIPAGGGAERRSRSGAAVDAVDAGRAGGGRCSNVDRI